MAVDSRINIKSGRFLNLRCLRAIYTVLLGYKIRFKVVFSLYFHNYLIKNQ